MNEWDLTSFYSAGNTREKLFGGLEVYGLELLFCLWGPSSALIFSRDVSVGRRALTRYFLQEKAILSLKIVQVKKLNIFGFFPLYIINCKKICKGDDLMKILFYR